MFRSVRRKAVLRNRKPAIRRPWLVGKRRGHLGRLNGHLAPENTVPILLMTVSRWSGDRQSESLRILAIFGRLRLGSTLRMFHALQRRKQILTASISARARTKKLFAMLDSA